MCIDMCVMSFCMCIRVDTSACMLHVSVVYMCTGYVAMHVRTGTLMQKSYSCTIAERFVRVCGVCVCVCVAFKCCIVSIFDLYTKGILHNQLPLLFSSVSFWCAHVYIVTLIMVMHACCYMFTFMLH